MSNKNEYRKLNLAKYREYAARYRRLHGMTRDTRIQRAFYRNKLYKDSVNYRLYRQHDALYHYYRRLLRDLSEKFSSMPYNLNQTPRAEQMRIRLNQYNRLMDIHQTESRKYYELYQSENKKSK